MTRLKTIGRATALTGLAVGLAMAATTGAAAQQVKLKYHHFSSPRGWDGTVMINAVIDRIEQNSKGRISIKVFPGMQLGGRPSALIDQVTDGVVDIVYTLPGYTAGRFPYLAGLELPFLGTTSAVAATAMAWDYYDAYGYKDFKGFRPLSIHLTDPGFLHTTKKKINRIEDLAGLKIRVASRYIGVTIKALGGVPVHMPLPAVYEALARGQVQGMMIPWLIMKPFKLHDVTRYHVDMPIFHSVILQVMSEKSYQKLPADLKAAIDKASGREVGNWIAVEQDKGGADSRAYGLKRGAVINQVSKAAMGAWVARASGAQNLWVKEMDKRGLNGAELLAFLKKTAKKYQTTAK